MTGPLDGIRVLELTWELGGAFAGQILADEGAELIKVEPPGGDPLRHVESYAPGESRLFQSLNRGKRSVVIDHRERSGAAAIESLTARADVLLCTWPVQVRQALGLEPSVLRERFPDLVSVAVTPVGEHGPWAHLPMGPLCLQAFSGLMAAEDERLPDGAPGAVVSTDMIERATGIYAALAASAGLFRRRRTGRGTSVRFSKLAVALYLQSGRTGDVPAADQRVRNPARDRILATRASGGSYQDQTAARAPITAVPGQVFYRAYRTADGAVFVGALSGPLRARARRVLETDFLARDDPRWDPDDPEFVAYCREQQALIEARFRAHTTAEWIRRCAAENVPAGEVVFPEDLADSEQVRANELMIAVNHAHGRQLQAAPFIRFRRHSRPEPAGAPTL